MSRVETERELRWLMTLRVVTVTTLLCSAFVIEVVLRPEASLGPLFRLTALAYGMVLGYAVADRLVRAASSLLALQLVGDALLITGFVQITGGLTSPLSFLYVLPISVAAVLLYRVGGLAAAGICWTLYAAQGATSWAPFGRLVPAAGDVDAGHVVYLLVAHLLALVAFALLSSYLSERLRLQGQALAEGQRTVARLRALNENIIESLSSGLITTGLDGRISFMNRGGAAILGLDPRAVENRPIDELFGFDQGFLRDARQRLLERRRFRIERYFDAPDGRRLYVGFAVSGLADRAGSALGYIFIFQDLTEIHALEQEMRLKERMVALGEMAAGMAHELRNPLASISGAVQFLKGTAAPEGEALELMDIILRESRRLDQAIRDFLTFARPGRFAPQAVDLVRLLEDNAKLLRRSPEFRPGHRIRTRYAAPRVEWCVDPGRMTQVFWNLATNALKAMPAGGTLTVEVATGARGTPVEIHFADEGSGMDERQRERYFQPFASGFDEGTGLGAAIVYRLVHEHGGNVRVATSAGHGTTVTVELPWHAQAEEHATGALALRAVGGRSA